MSHPRRTVVTLLLLAGFAAGCLWPASPSSAVSNTPQDCYPGELCYTRYPWKQLQSAKVWVYVRQFGGSISDYRVHPWWQRNVGWISARVNDEASDFRNANACRVRIFRDPGYRGRSSTFGDYSQRPHWRYLGDFTIGDNHASSHLECV